jgi:succinoglycan biosynthesis transport protein ExoP
MEEELDLRHYLGVIRRHILLVIFTAIVVGGAALGTSLLERPRYRATSTILFSPQTQNLLGTSSEDPARVLSTLAELATNNEILTKAASAMNSTVADLSQTISVNASSDQDILRLSATDTDAQRAARKANAVATAFLAWRTQTQETQTRAQIAVLLRQLRDLEARGANADQTVVAALQGQLAEARAQLASPSSDLSLVQRATAPGQPYSPHPVRNMIIGLLGGVLLGILAAFLRERMGRRLYGVEEVERIYGRPSLGIVPFVGAAARGNRSAAIGDYGGSSMLAEAYRTIRANLALFQINKSSIKTVVISSAMPNEGKSAVTANLAAALASSGRKVLAISADLRSPALHKYFPEAEGDGLLEILSGEATLEQAVRTIVPNGDMPSKTGGRFSLLANDRSFLDPVVLFQSIAMTNLLKEVRARYDVVLFDTPPILTNADTYVLAQQTDALLLVARLDRITRAQARRTRATLQTAKISPLGLIITGMREHDEAYGYNYSYNGPGESA